MEKREHNSGTIWPKTEQRYWHNMVLLLAQSIKAHGGIVSSTQFSLRMQCLPVRDLGSKRRWISLLGLYSLEVYITSVHLEEDQEVARRFSYPLKNFKSFQWDRQRIEHIFVTNSFKYVRHIHSWKRKLPRRGTVSIRTDFSRLLCTGLFFL